MVDVEADAWFPVAGRDGALIERVTVEQVGAGLVDRGLATRDEIERHLENLAAGRLDVATAPLVSARGRRPEAPSV